MLYDYSKVFKVVMQSNKYEQERNQGLRVQV